MGLLSNDPAATNVANVITNSMVSQINQTTMACYTSSSNLNYQQLTVNIVDSAESINNIDIVQKTNALVSPDCVMSSEVLNSSSVSLATSVDQYAEAIQNGVRSPPAVNNTTNVVQTVSQNLLNTFDSVCSQDASNKNISVATVNVTNSPGSTNNIRVAQENNAEFLAECMTTNYQGNEADQTIETTISQIAKTKSANLFLLMAIALAIITISILVLGLTLRFFGQSFAEYGWKVALALGMFFAVIVGFAWAMMKVANAGPYYPDELPYSEYDDVWEPGEGDEDQGEMGCKNGGEIQPGYLTCLQNPLTYPQHQFVFSYACPSEAPTFQNTQIDWSYYRRAENWVKLPPNLFRDIDCKDSDAASTDYSAEIIAAAKQFCTASGQCSMNDTSLLCKGREKFHEKYSNDLALAQAMGSAPLPDQGEALYGSYNMGLCCPRGARTSFENGLQCNTFVIDTVGTSATSPSALMETDRFFGCEKQDTTGGYTCTDLLKGTYQHYNFQQLTGTRAFNGDAALYDATLVSAAAGDADALLRLHRGVVEWKWGNDQSRSPFDLGWVGDGITKSQWEQITDPLNFNHAVPGNAHHYHNPRGYACISDNDVFVFTPNAAGLPLVPITAPALSMTGTRTYNTPHCVAGQSSSLDLIAGFTCQDYNTDAVRGGSQMSMCCRTTIDGTGTLPIACTPYAAWQNPYECVKGDAALLAHQTSMDDLCGTCRGLLGSASERTSQPCARWNNEKVRFTDVGACLLTDETCPF